MELVNLFLDRYALARTRRGKALALYNAVVAAVPADRVRDFLGEGGDDFLYFIRTLQNEDADIGTAVAREADAPSEAYLSALREKLIRLD